MGPREAKLGGLGVGGPNSVWWEGVQQSRVDSVEQ